MNEMIFENYLLKVDMQKNPVKGYNIILKQCPECGCDMIEPNKYLQNKSKVCCNCGLLASDVKFV